MSSFDYDVAIIGGGPSGSTASTILKKYAPDMKVLVLEREKFPRDHIGESLLPVCSGVLNEMDCWDKIEGANFPVKIGATYRWGCTKDLWDFEFVPAGAYQDAPRPAKYEGQRRLTAFQVDRAIYDEILLDHAAENGVEVRQETKVVKVHREGDRVTGLELQDGTIVTARYYIDGSGHSGLIRRTMDVEFLEPSALRNIAVWDYWQNADWAVEIGVSGTRIQVMSMGWGWIWFIPLGPTRTSIGLVMPAEYYKKSGKRPEQLYHEALEDEPRIKMLLTNATAEGKLETTKDWSFLASRMVGENWFLVGEAAGFADPILSAGVTLAHVSAKEAAYTIMELDKGEHDPEWLKEQFGSRQARRIGNHIKFADYWYTANAQFTELIDFTSEIAKDAGLELDGKQAWQWLGTGGFVDEEAGGAGFGAYTLAATKSIVNELSQTSLDWHIAKNNVFLLDLKGAEKTVLAFYNQGKIDKTPAYTRNGKTIPDYWVFGFLIKLLQQTGRADEILRQIDNHWCTQPSPLPPVELFQRAIQALEAMVDDGWVKASYAKHMPLIDAGSLTESFHFHRNNDNRNQVATA